MNDKKLSKSNFTLNIESKLRSLAGVRHTSPWHPADYIIGQSKSDLIFLNITTPKVRSLTKNLPADAWDFKDVYNLWFESLLFDGKSVTLHWLEKQSIAYLVTQQKKLVAMASTIDNWAHADALCNLLAKIYEADPAYLNQVYKKWNTHRNPWYRRLSMVGLFYYSRLRSKQPSYKLSETFIKENLAHPHYYVQKGVGWTLREMYNVYPKETLRLITGHIKQITPIAWVAASEKMTVKEKQKLLSLRKK